MVKLLRSTAALLISKLTHRYERIDGSQGQCSSIAAIPKWHLGEEQFELRMFNDRKKFEKKKKKKKKNGEWRMENFRQRMVWGLKCVEWKENGEWEGAPFLHSSFFVLHSPICYSKIIPCN
jgi:hypothetical protein